MHDGRNKHSRLKHGVEARMRRTKDLPGVARCHVSNPEGEMPGMRVTVLVGEREEGVDVGGEKEGKWSSMRGYNHV